MTNFKIKFTFENAVHTSDIQKIPLVNNLPVQWHAFNITPAIVDAPNPYIFLYTPNEQRFTFALFNNGTDLGNAIFNSIKEYCIENGISINDQQ